MLLRVADADLRASGKPVALRGPSVVIPRARTAGGNCHSNPFRVAVAAVTEAMGWDGVTVFRTAPARGGGGECETATGRVRRIRDRWWVDGIAVT